MPVEGQWRRARTPIGRRDKLLLAVAAAVAVVAALVGALALAQGGGGSGDCLVVRVPSTMGGATLRQCGAAAHEFCRTQAPADTIVADACREQGYLP